MSSPELLADSFAALESWAWDENHERTPDETPAEFAVRLGKAFPALDDATRQLVALYVRVLYANVGIPGSANAVARKFWDALSSFKFHVSSSKLQD